MQIRKCDLYSPWLLSPRRSKHCSWHNPPTRDHCIFQSLSGHSVIESSVHFWGKKTRLSMEHPADHHHRAFRLWTIIETWLSESLHSNSKCRTPQLEVEWRLIIIKWWLVQTSWAIKCIFSVKKLEQCQVQYILHEEERGTQNGNRVFSNVLLWNFMTLLPYSGQALGRWDT